MNLGEKIRIINELSSLHSRFTICPPMGVDASVHNDLISPLLIIINTGITFQIDLAMRDN